MPYTRLTPNLTTVLEAMNSLTTRETNKLAKLLQEGIDQTGKVTNMKVTAASIAHTVVANLPNIDDGPTGHVQSAPREPRPLMAVDGNELVARLEQELKGSVDPAA